MIILYSAQWIVPVSAPPIKDGVLAVSDGRILAVGPAEQVVHDFEGQQIERRDMGESIVCPGFVNTHTHLELTVLRGTLEDLSFTDWIDGVVAMKRLLSAEDLLASARWGVLDAIRSGTTTVGEIVDHGESVQAISEGGLRAVAFQEIYDLHQEPLDAALERLAAELDAHRKYAGDRLKLGVSPHSPMTVSRGLFHRLAEKSIAEGIKLAIHAAESREEVELLTAGTGAMAALFRSRRVNFAVPGITPISYLASAGVLEARPLLVHAVHAGAGEIELIARSGAAVAHCPKSNAKLGHGIAPIASMLPAEIAVGLGTDSMASNNSSDLIEEARFALLIQRATSDPGMRLTAQLALEMATLGGARALGLDRETGSLVPGKRADFVAVSLREPALVPATSPEAALIFGASARDVRLVAVDGEVLYDHGTFTRWNEQALRREVLSASRHLSARRSGRASSEIG